MRIPVRLTAVALASCAVIVFTACVLTYSIIMEGTPIYELVSKAYQFPVVGAFWPLVCGLYWKRSTRQGAIWSIVLGMSTWALLEYTPLGDVIRPLRLFRNLVSEIPELDPGAERQPLFVLGSLPTRRGDRAEIRAGTIICFEVAFPARCRAWRSHGARVSFAPTFPTTNCGERSHSIGFLAFSSPHKTIGTCRKQPRKSHPSKPVPARLMCARTEIACYGLTMCAS